MPLTVYHRDAFQLDDRHPARGWYVGRHSDEAEPIGPYHTEQRAEEALHGLRCDAVA